MKVIRISDIVHEQLKREAKAEGRTLQWVVENKLTSGNTPPAKNTAIIEVADDAVHSTPDVSDLLKDHVSTEIKKAVEVSKTDLEMPCCSTYSPCRHWSWDGIKEGYTNSLSGRFRGAEEGQV